ncbi:MAG: 4-hydroxy-3-methylbut-2-enyl diphosphate reductase [Lachnospiraceae bacterium]|nr:4-hydroxy-3-methylbut-2-enyl diphosphate reductase [Lachnospiraceae bacterium]
MKITVAKTAGFCFGVKRAMEKVYEQAEHSGGPIYTFGPIIHNEAVVGDLEKRGVHVIETEEELCGLTKGTVIIRSHGVSRHICDEIKAKGLKLVDATCPFVKKIHQIVEERSEEGYTIVIVGSSSHPEVEGIRGWCRGKSVVLKDLREAQNLELDPKERVCVVSQTTFNYKKFQDIVEILEERGYNSIVVNTICNATHERQVEAREVASNVDSMIVIGGKNSSNTQKLYEICRSVCANTYYIQTFEDLQSQNFQSGDSVGITAGASTPNTIIEEVHKNVGIKL